MIISSYGISIDLPQGWEGRIFVNPPQDDGSLCFPRLHAGNFPIPLDGTGFAFEAIREMGKEDVLLALVEYSPRRADKPAFASKTLSPIQASQLQSNAFHGPRPDYVSAVQVTFTLSGRPFCLYVVGSTVGDLETRLQELNAALVTLRISRAQLDDYSAGAPR